MGYREQHQDYGDRPSYPPRPAGWGGYAQRNSAPVRPEPPAPSREEVLSENHFVFKNKCYSTQQLSLLSRTGIKVTIKEGDLHKNALSLVDTTCGAEAKTHDRIVVTQYEGKLVILMGHNSFQKLKAAGGEIPASLMSNVVLKKAHIWDN